MNDLRKAAQQALEALEGFVYHGIGPNSGPALASLRAALAQPDPVEMREGWEYMREKGLLRKPLTDEEVYALVDATIGNGRCEFARAIEKAHGIGGGS